MEIKEMKAECRMQEMRKRSIIGDFSPYVKRSFTVIILWVNYLQLFTDDEELEIDIYETISKKYIDTTADIVIVEDSAFPTLQIDVEAGLYLQKMYYRLPSRLVSSGSISFVGKPLRTCSSEMN